MANTNLFASIRGALLPAATARNEAGGQAYARSAEQALALYASTGCLNGTFYASADEQLATVLALCEQVPAGFVAQTAVHARRVARMKDMPALLLATLAVRDGELFARTFGHVVDNGRMLRNVVQILRSGAVGRKSLGSRPKRLVQQWLANASVEQLLHANIGTSPSLADVIRMVHPTPVDGARRALYAWIVGRPYDVAALPAAVQAYEAFKRAPVGELPALPFQYFTSLALDVSHWRALARQASWQTLRQNLNAFARHGVFDDAATTAALAAKLADPEQVRRARVFPYQLLMAYTAAGGGVPAAIRAALQDAMEAATRQVPTIAGNVVVAVDVSGSMGSPVTGYRKGASTAVRCVDVAALIAACVQRTNPSAWVLPFDTDVRPLQLNPRDSVMTQAKQLASLCGGGTSVSAPLKRLNAVKAHVDLLVLVSDNESWKDTRGGGATETMRQWAAIKARCPQAKLVLVDLQPVATSQAVERDDVLFVGGFSDAVFELIALVAEHGGGAARWVDRIAAIEL
jgi:60 kDa SS-A/Ro ribonucleoprotein